MGWDLATSTLGKYRLIAELGHGGMADVYLAVASGMGGFNKLLVLKQLRPALVDDPEFLQMFLDEAKLAARLSHPNVVHTYEVGREGERYYIAMEYLEGQPLNRIVRRAERSGGFPMDLYLSILVHVLNGLHYAHELADYDGTPLHVVHRDLTPHNIFVTYGGEVKIVDFGIAKALDSTAETRTGVLKGKLSYMSPEQARSEKVDRRADIFSAGVMIWEAMAGRRMWQEVEGVTILQRLVTGDLPQLDPALQASDRIKRIAMRALAVGREDRFATAEDLQTALEAWLSDQPTRYGARDIGEYVSRMFVKDRKKIGAIIDDRLRNPSSLPDAGAVPAALPRLNVGNFSSASLRSNSAEPSLDFVDRSPGVDLNSSSPPGPSGAPMVGIRGYESISPKRSGFVRILPVLIAGGIVATAVLVGVKALRGTNAVSAAPPSSQSAASPSSEPAASADAPATVEVRFVASPTNARLTLDGAALPGNPHTARYPRDGKTHLLRAEAPGFGTATHELVFERDRVIELTLQQGRTAVFVPARASAAAEPHAKDAATPVQTAAPGQPTTDPMELDRTPQKKKPRRPIDTENPWQ